MNPEPILAIRARGLTHRYGSIVAIDKRDLDIPGGAITGLIGRNGAGKSTFLRLCAGLIKASNGELTVLGKDPWNAPTRQRQDVAMVLQDVRLPLQKTLTELAGVYLDNYPTFDQLRFAKICDRFGLDRQRTPGALSGGQQRLAASALVLSSGAKVLLLDEPAAGLDPIARADLIDVILETVDDDRTTVVYSTHLLADLERGAAYVVDFSPDRPSQAMPVTKLQEMVRRVQIILPRDWIFQNQGNTWAIVSGQQQFPLTDLEHMQVLGPVATGVAYVGNDVNETGPHWEKIMNIPGIHIQHHHVGLEEAYILLQRRHTGAPHA